MVFAIPKGTFDNLGPVEISSATGDGRRNSCFDEDTLISHLREKGFSVKVPVERHWYDCTINGYPVQIKSSNGGTDNWSSRKALLWCLTDLTMQEIDSHANRQSKIQETLCGARRSADGELLRDIDILVIHKQTGEVHHTRLCELDTLTSNGSNLPFQINWNKSIFKNPQRQLPCLVERTQDQAFNFLIGAYLEAIRKKQAQDRPELLSEALLRVST